MPIKCFVDTETTGIDPIIHGVIQIGLIIEQPLADPEHLNVTCCPFPSDVIDPKALEANNTDEELIRAYQDPSVAKKEIGAFLGRHVNKYNSKDRLLFYGYNARFDFDMLINWWKKTGDNYFFSYFWSPPIDVMSLAAEHLRDARPDMLNFKQGTVAEHLGIQVDPNALHDAAYDAEIARQIYHAVTM